MLLLGGGDAQQTNSLRGSNVSGSNVSAASALDSSDHVAHAGVTGAVLDANISNASTLEASWLPAISGGKILLASTGLCLSHEANWVSTNRVKATACYGGSNQLWTVRGSEIKSYSDGGCLDYDVSWLTKGRVNLWGCHGKQNQKWSFVGGFIKSLYDGRCLEYNTHDQYVNMAACDRSGRNINQHFRLQE